MGHIRLKRLPASRKWREVVGLLSAGAPVEKVALASFQAAEAALHGARGDPVLAYSLWLLSQLPLAARAPNFPDAAGRLGLDIGRDPSLFKVIGAFSDTQLYHSVPSRLRQSPLDRTSKLANQFVHLPVADDIGWRDQHVIPVDAVGHTCHRITDQPFLHAGSLDF